MKGWTAEAEELACQDLYLLYQACWTLYHLGKHSCSTGANVTWADGSGTGVAAVHPEISTRHIAARIAEQEGNSAHQVFGTTHLALRDQARPLFRQLWIFVEDLTCSGCDVSCC